MKCNSKIEWWINWASNTYYFVSFSDIYFVYNLQTYILALAAQGLNVVIMWTGELRISDDLLTAR